MQLSTYMTDCELQLILYEHVPDAIFAIIVSLVNYLLRLIIRRNTVLAICFMTYFVNKVTSVTLLLTLPINATSLTPCLKYFSRERNFRLYYIGPRKYIGITLVLINETNNTAIALKIEFPNILGF